VLLRRPAARPWPPSPSRCCRLTSGVTKTHSRSRVWDNPFSESQFKTLKYCPIFPGTFASVEDSRTFCAEFFHAYDHHHRHAGLGLLTTTSCTPAEQRPSGNNALWS
jgi:hypothetical protein